jgi:AraC-like DNA-binding protein
MPAMHFHAEFEIYYLFDGTRYYFIENKTHTIKKGSLVLVNSMQIHRTSACGRAPHDRFLIELTSEPFSGFFRNICGLSLENLFAELSGIWELDEAGQRYVEKLLDEITDEFRGQREFYASLAMMKIAELLLFAARLKTGGQGMYGASLSHASKHKQTQVITEYISANYAKVKSLDEICKAFFISKSYLCRIFKEVTGYTVLEYINMRRVKKAQEYLENGEMNVAEISAALGYGTVTHFERMFRKYTETTPLKYRQKARLIRRKVRERKSEEEN